MSQAIPDRHLRLWPQEYKQDEAKQSKILKWQDGILMRPLHDEQGSTQLVTGVHVAGQSLVINFEQKYPDDVVALVRDVYVALNKSNPSEYNERVIGFLNQAVYEADRRAVARHGYSHSLEEQQVTIPAEYNDENRIALANIK